MKVSDYIIQTLKKNNIHHFFGYQGTMIAHFVDSIGKDSEVYNHSCYNEQAAAFAACGHAKLTGECAVAYATSGPGALNLLSGIADAYYDSCPVLFITGQINKYEYTGVENLRQHSFQEADVVSMARPVTKLAIQIEREEDIPTYLEKALKTAMEGRKGPVLLDIPMNVQRGQVDAVPSRFSFDKPVTGKEREAAAFIAEALVRAKRPLLLLGNGIHKSKEARVTIVQLLEKIQIPVISSMLCRDLLPSDHSLNYGYIGAAYGHRYANLLAYKKTDLIISLGCSMCKRQTGMKPERFAENAQIIRVDIDPVELSREIHSTEISFLADATAVLEILGTYDIEPKREWLSVCAEIKAQLRSVDLNNKYSYPKRFMDVLGQHAKKNAVFVADVGQHQIWAAQSLRLDGTQRLLFSGGHGAMGFALPAAIGAQYATGERVYAICGDGCLQMNIQELQWLVRDKLNVTVIVLNNHSLGLIQQQQDDFFDSQYYGANVSGGYSVPEFSRIAGAYGIENYKVFSPDELENALKMEKNNVPLFIEVSMNDGTKAYPKTYFGEEMYNQKPYIPSETMHRLLEL